jgi:hypothetical protein
MGVVSAQHHSTKGSPLLYRGPGNFSHGDTKPIAHLVLPYTTNGALYGVTSSVPG